MAKKQFSGKNSDKYFKGHKFRNKKNSSYKSGKKRFLVTALIISLFSFAGAGLYIVNGLPSLEELENPKPQLASKVYTSDGELLGQFFIENRIETHIDSLPQHLIDALIATEDRKFYDHWGVNFTRFVQAMVKNVFTMSREGASTITQQLAKNLYKLKSGRESTFDTVIRKIREWLTAIQIEKTYTKKEILELYLNVSYLGKSAYGVESAARVYFGKKGIDLTLPESALLVALLKSSVIYDPVRRTENALRRRNQVMYNMVTEDKLDQSVYDQLKEIPIKLASEKISPLQSKAPHFMELVRQQMPSLAEKYGFDLYRDGLNIYTTLDMKMQKIANRVAAEHLKEYQAIFNKNWDWSRNKETLRSLIDKAVRNSEAYRNALQTEKQDVYDSLKNNPAFIDSVKKAESTIQVGFVVLDPRSGQIKALVGGENQEFLYGLNHVTQIRRQPGSAFKPIVYTVAIDNGLFPSYSLLNQKFDYNGWSPNNSDDEYGGYMTLREALAYSVNVVAGRLTISDASPPATVLKYAKKLGISSELPPYPSIALGTAEITPLELTSAFGTFANNGVHVEPISILKIEDRNGILIDQFAPEAKEAISVGTASIITNMLQDVVNYGTGAGVRKYFYRPAAGKTGTTQNFSDAWFVGFTPQLVGGVWVGFDDHRVKFNGWYGQGARAAMPIWAKFMAETYQQIDIPLEYFELGPGVVSASFCKQTIAQGDARIATENCPEIVIDIINSKNLPQVCDLHSGRARSIGRDSEKGDSGW